MIQQKYIVRTVKNLTLNYSIIYNYNWKNVYISFNADIDSNES